MFLSILQQKCLEKMGVTVYARGEVYTPMRRVYWVCLEEELTEPKQQLLSRMLAALQWPIEECIIFQANDITNQDNVPVAGILLSDRSDAALQLRHQQIIQVPSLQKLLESVEAKREAWKKMQEICYSSSISSN